MIKLNQFSNFEIINKQSSNKIKGGNHETRKFIEFPGIPINESSFETNEGG